MENATKMMSLLVAAILVGSIVPAAAIAERGGPETGGVHAGVTVGIGGSGPENETEHERNGSGRGSGEGIGLGLGGGARMGNATVRGEFRDALRARLEDMKQARDDYKERRQEFRDAKDAYADLRGKLLSVRGQLNACKSSESDDCVQARENFSATAKDFLISAAAKITSHLDALDTYVDANVANDTLKASLKADIDSVRGNVEAQVVTINALPDNATRAQLEQARDSLNDALKETRRITLAVSARLVTEKADEGTDTLHALRARLASVRDELESKGADVTRLDSLLAQFDAKLDASAQAYADAQAKYDAARSGDVNAQALADFQAAAKASRQDFADAVALVREILQEIRSLSVKLAGDAAANATARLGIGTGILDAGANASAGVSA